MKELLQLAESKGLKLPIFKWDDESLYYYALCHIQKWLRDEFNIDCEPMRCLYEGKHYSCIVLKDTKQVYHTGETIYSSYEEALKIGLPKALELV